MSKKDPTEIKYKSLKRDQNFAGIIALYEDALANKEGLSDKDKALFYNRIATAYLYLGKYDEVLKAVKGALSYLKESSSQLIDTNQKAKTLCLASSAYIAKGDKKNAEKCKAHILGFLIDGSISGSIRGIIYFTAGDIENLLGDIAEASSYYSSAAGCFKTDSYNHSKARLCEIACELQLGKPRGAQIKVEKLNIQPDTEMFVHLLGLKADICVKLNQYGEAHKFASNALDLAEKKNMTKEYDVLKKSVAYIEKNSPATVAVVKSSLVNTIQSKLAL